MPTQIYRDGSFEIEITNFAGSLNDEDPRSKDYPDSNTPYSRNAQYNANGAIMKRFGYDVVSQVAGEGGIRGLLPYKKTGAEEEMLIFSYDKTEDVVKVYKVSPSNMEWTLIDDYGDDNGGPVNGMVLLDTAIFGNGVATNSVKKYSGSTISALGGSAPNGSLFAYYNNIPVIGGVLTSPSTAYHGETGTVETWTGANAGAIAVEDGDGSILTAILATQDAIIAFKEYAKYGLQVVYDAEELATGLAKKDVNDRSYGAVAGNSVVPFGDGFLFLSHSGFRTYGADENSGQFRRTRPLSQLIKSYVRNINYNALSQPVAIEWEDFYLCAVPYNGTQKNSAVFIFDFNYKAWRIWEMPISYFARFKNQIGNQHLYFGHPYEQKLCKFNSEFMDDKNDKNKAIEFEHRSKIFRPGIMNHWQTVILEGSTTDPGLSYIYLNVDGQEKKYAIDSTEEGLLQKTSSGYIGDHLVGSSFVGGFNLPDANTPKLYRFKKEIHLPDSLNQGREMYFTLFNDRKNEGVLVDRALIRGKVLQNYS